MSGLDKNLRITVTYKGFPLYCGPAFWSWDDDDESQIRVNITVPKPPEGLFNG